MKSLLYAATIITFTVFAVIACKQGSGEAEALRLPDSVTVRKPLSSAESRKPAPKPTNQSTSGSQTTSGSGDGTESAISAINRNKIWWDNRSIFFLDYVEGTQDIVHEAVKGQPYFPETKIFIYSTDAAMEGTYPYEKVELSLVETPLDDRIFIWVHLNDKHEVEFVKTLISDNIKDKMNEAPLKIQ